MKTKMLGLALAAAFAASAQGAAVTFDFVSSLLSTQPDRTIAFSGTVTNTGPAAAFLNADEFTFPLPLNDTPFFLNFPLSLAPGTSVTATLFMVTVPAGTPVGLYVGTF